MLFHFVTHTNLKKKKEKKTGKTTKFGKQIPYKILKYSIEKMQTEAENNDEAYMMNRSEEG